MNIDITKNEAWKILDALKSYKKDYALSGAVEKTIDTIIKKVKDITNEKLVPYSEELKGSIILSIDGVKATDVESISRSLGSKTEKESVQVEILLKTGQLMRIII
jgi:S1-C subfamily serine protease